MRILLILFFLLQASYLKANEINYLLDIPNLEIYKLNNTNGIKYLNAKKNFIIGINNNISCNKATKENLNKKFPIIKQNLEIYDSDFLKKINLRFIVLCEGLYISEIISIVPELANFLPVLNNVIIFLNIFIFSNQNVLRQCHLISCDT